MRDKGISDLQFAIVPVRPRRDGGRIVCKKGGLALVELPNANSRHGELVWLLPSKVSTR